SQAPGAGDRHPPTARRSPGKGGGQPRHGSRPCAGSRVRAQALLPSVCLGGQTRGHARLPRKAPGPLQRAMSDVVLSTRDGAVRILTLNRPEALNALNRETTHALRTEVETAGRDPEVGAQLIVVFVRVGLVPDAGSLFFLTRMLGLSKATELAITGDPVSADEALRLGLVVAVVPPEQLMPAAMERARHLAAGPRQTYALIKRGMDRALHLDL